MQGINSAKPHLIQGTFVAHIRSDLGNSIRINLKQALQPQDGEQLICWMQLQAMGWELHDAKNKAMIISPNNEPVSLIRIGGFLFIPLESSITSTKRSLTMQQLHEGLNHIIATPQELIKLGQLQNIKVTTDEIECAQCELTNIHHTKVRTYSLYRSLVLLYRCYVDLFGPFPKSHQGNQYGIQIVDECSRYGEVTFTKSREASQVLPALKKMIQELENMTHRKVVILRHDNEKALISTLARTMKTQEQWREERTSPHTPEQQSVVERRIVLNWSKVIKMYGQAQLSMVNKSLTFIEDIYKMANAVSNHSFTAANGNRAPPISILASIIGTRPPNLPVIEYGALCILKKEGHKEKGGKYNCESPGKYAMCIGYAPNLSNGVKFRCIKDDQLTNITIETMHYSICNAPHRYAATMIKTKDSNTSFPEMEWFNTINERYEADSEDTGNDIEVMESKNTETNNHEKEAERIENQQSNAPTNQNDAPTNQNEDNTDNDDVYEMRNHINEHSTEENKMIETIDVDEPTIFTKITLNDRKAANEIKDRKAPNLRNTIQLVHREAGIAYCQKLHPGKDLNKLYKRQTDRNFAEYNYFKGYVPPPTEILQEITTTETSTPPTAPPMPTSNNTDETEEILTVEMHHATTKSAKFSHTHYIPESWKELKQLEETNPEKKTWMEQYKNDYKSYFEATEFRAPVFSLIKRSSIPANSNIIYTKPVYELKEQVDGKIKRKARLVATDKTEYPKDRTSAPVLMIESRNFLLGLSAQEDEELDTLDISQAYMHAPISKDIPTYVNQAPGLETVPLNAPNDANPEEYILQVHQAFNGLGIAGNLFYHYLREKLIKMKATPNKKDPALYCLYGRDIPFDMGYGPIAAHARILIGTHVDDFLTVNNNGLVKKYFRDQLSASFPWRDTTGEKILGLQVTKVPHGIQVSMEDYIDEFIITNKLEYLTHAKVPLLASQDLEYRQQYILKCEDRGPIIQQEQFEKIHGSLIYIAHATALEIKNVLRMLSPHTSEPTQILWDILLQVVRYLKHARADPVCYYNTSGDNQVSLMTDASHAMEKNGYSAMGYAIHMFGGPIKTSSVNNHDVYQHSYDAELEGLQRGIEATLLFKEIIEEYSPQLPPTKVYNDNAAAVHFGNSEGSKPYKRHHVRTRVLMVQDEVRKGAFKLIHTPHKRLFTDIFTKASGEKKFKKFRELLKQGGKQEQVLTKGTNNRKKNKKISWKSPLATWDRS